MTVNVNQHQPSTIVLKTDTHKSIQVDIACMYCSETVESSIADIGKTIRKLAGEGWLVLQDAEEAIDSTDLICPECRDVHTKLMRLSRHSREIPGCDERYIALDSGEICKFYGKPWWDGSTWRRWGCELLPCTIDKGGYKKVSVKVGGSSKSIPVHRLVATAWHGYPADGQVVDHINRCRYDNRPENLRWVSAKENASNRTPRRPLVAVGDDGTVVRYASASTATFIGNPKALMSADRAYFGFVDGVVFVDEDVYDQGLDMDPYIEQMLEARVIYKQLKKKYFDALGVSGFDKVWEKEASNG